MAAAARRTQQVPRQNRGMGRTPCQGTTDRHRARAYDRAPMLHRPNVAPAVRATRPPRRARAGVAFQGTPRRAIPARLRRWLCAPGSLTARLRCHGTVSVEVISQGRQTLWPQERATLASSQGHVREVVLRVDGRAAIWARSATPLAAVKGPWRAIKGLGKRPLAELLFEQQRVQRGRIGSQAFRRQSPQRQHLARQWAGLQPASTDPAPLWARQSVFRHHGHPLQVLESFATWVTRLPAGR
jgi:chorismate--pyruvate lyase